jgi:hypothetical protein
MDEKKADLSVIEKLLGLKVPLGMIISELSFYEGMLDLTLKNKQTFSDVPGRITAEVVQSIEAAIELLESIRNKLKGCLAGTVKKNE